MRERLRISSGTPWEPVVGYSRAVGVGPVVSSIRPACTMVEVRRLVAPEMLVEIEAEDQVPEPEGS